MDSKLWIALLLNLVFSSNVQIWNWISFLEISKCIVYWVLNDDVDQTLLYLWIYSLKNVQYFFLFLCIFLTNKSRTKQMRLEVAIEHVECYALFSLSLSLRFFSCFSTYFSILFLDANLFYRFFSEWWPERFENYRKNVRIQYKSFIGSVFLLLCSYRIHNSQLWFTNSENKFFFFHIFVCICFSLHLMSGTPRF